MFHPMAITVVLALTGAMLLSLTFVPAAVAHVPRRPRGGEGEPRHAVDRGERYAPLLAWSLRRRMRGAGGRRGAGGAVRAARHAAGHRVHPEPGRRRHRRACAAHSRHQPDPGGAMQAALEQSFARFPEVERVFSKIGTAEIANDPMPPSVTDTFVMLKPREHWPDPRKPKARAARGDRSRRPALPGNNYEFTQPIQMRMNELISGVRADVAVKVYGDDLDQLVEVGRADRSASTRRVPGAADVKTEQVTGLPLLTVMPDRAGAGALRPQSGRRAGHRGDGRRRRGGRPVVRRRPALRHRRAACRKHCARIRPRLADLPIPLRDSEQRGRVQPRRQLDGRRRRVRCRCAKWRRIEIRARPEPDQPRERQAPRGGDRQRARPRPRRLRARTAAARRRAKWRCRRATGSSTAARSSS